LLCAYLRPSNIDGAKHAWAILALIASATELAGLMKDPEEMFYRVSDGMKAIAASGYSAQVAQDLMSRSGTMMRPMLEQGSAALKQNAADIIALGGAYTDSDASMGQSVAELETRLDASMNGIEKAFAKPILQALIDNSGLLSADMGELAGWIGTNLPNAIGVAEPLIKEFAQDVKILLDAITGKDGGELFKDMQGKANENNMRALYDFASPNQVSGGQFIKDAGKDLVFGHLFYTRPDDSMLWGHPSSPGGYGTQETMLPAYTAAQRGATAPHVTVNAPVTIDASKLAEEFVRKAKPAMRRASASLQTQLHAATKKADAQDYGL
jgi:hypothetical protein